MTSKGTFIAVVGASGVGKDSILDGARPKLEETGNFYFPQRTITRVVDAGGETHNAVSVQEFDQMCEQGKFSLTWDAHGLRYGIPIEAKEKIESGISVVANISRSTVSELPELFGQAAVIEITASSQIIHQRLVDRGRESKSDIVQRTNRKVDNDWLGSVQLSTLSNDGVLDAAIHSFVELVANLSVKTAQSTGMVSDHPGRQKSRSNPGTCSPEELWQKAPLLP